jgi:hypothetical protein
MKKYSEKLINQTINCFRVENDLIISPEKAEEYLDSLADLYVEFADKPNK